MTTVIKCYRWIFFFIPIINSLIVVHFVLFLGDVVSSWWNRHTPGTTCELLYSSPMSPSLAPQGFICVNPSLTIQSIFPHRLCLLFILIQEFLMMLAYVIFLIIFWCDDSWLYISLHLINKSLSVVSECDGEHWLSYKLSSASADLPAD